MNGVIHNILWSVGGCFHNRWCSQVQTPSFCRIVARRNADAKFAQIRIFCADFSQISAVHPEHLPGDEGSGIGKQEGAGVGDIIRGAQAAKRGLLGER